MISPWLCESLHSINWQVFPTVPTDDVLEQVHQFASLFWLQMPEELSIILVGKLSQDWHEPLTRRREFDRLIPPVAFRGRSPGQHLPA